MVTAAAATEADAFPTLVSAEWLKQNLGQVKVLDATWYLPNAGKDAVAEHKAERIPGALLFGAAAGPVAELLHVLPADCAAAFAGPGMGCCLPLLSLGLHAA